MYIYIYIMCYLLPSDTSAAADVMLRLRNEPADPKGPNAGGVFAYNKLIFLRFVRGNCRHTANLSRFECVALGCVLYDIVYEGYSSVHVRREKELSRIFRLDIVFRFVR